MPGEIWSQTPVVGVYRAPAVTVFFVVCLVLWLTAPEVGTESWRDVNVLFDSPTLQSVLVSHLFHPSGLHLVVNLLAVVLIGMILESHWGTLRFLCFYLLCAWGGTLVTLLMSQIFTADGYSCGASSVALGCLVVYGFLFPQTRPARWVPASKYLMWTAIFVGAGCLILLPSLGPHVDEGNPYYLPQVAGVPLAIGFLWLLPIHQRWLTARAERRAAAERQRVRDIRKRVDQLLEKISTDGYESLSRDELSFLRDASKHFRDDD